RVGGLQMTEAFFRVLDNADVASGGDGDAARIGHLFDEEHVSAGIMRFDGSNGTGIAIAHDHHVGRLVPPFLRFAACRRMPAHCRIRLNSSGGLDQLASAGCAALMLKRWSSISFNRREPGTLPSFCWSATAAAR